MNFFRLTIFIFIFGLLSPFSFASAGVILSSYEYAWSNNSGYINFANVEVGDTALSGYAWSANHGWIKFNPANGGVLNDGQGNLSGSAWGENLGWIDFGGVSISAATGKFSGAATGTLIGTLTFDCPNYCDVRTDWRPVCVSWTYSDWSGCSGGRQSRTIISSSPSGCGGGNPILSQSCSSGGGLPSAAYDPPAIPRAGFKISINQGAEYTNNFTVSLSFVAGKDTVKMAISESSDFINAIQIPYQQELKWELLPILNGQIPKQGMERTIYVKFYTQYGVSSQVYSDSIILVASLPEITPLPAPFAPSGAEGPPSPEIADNQKIPSSPKPTPAPLPDAEANEAEPAPPYFQTPPEKLKPINPDWNLIKLPEVKNFFPQPNEISFFTQKFPSLSETFKKLGISQIADMTSRASEAGFNIPSLSEILALQPADSNISSISPFLPAPLVDLPVKLKEQIPSEIVFVSAASEKISLNSSLVLDEGSLKQKISARSSENLSIALKPDLPARSISGYLALKKSAYSANPAPNDFSFWDNLSYLLFSSAFAEENKVEQRFVLAQFQYADPDKDGIWTADIQTPAVVGEYEIISLIAYQDPSLPPKEIRLITVIDPEGYVYEKIENQELRIMNAEISIYWLNPADNQYELWNAKDFDQKNPQTTDATGKYSFLVPAGSYYIKAEAPGYHPLQTDIFEVSEAKNVHMNLELKPAWSLARDWKTAAIIILVILMAYNFYKDRRRERNLQQF